MVGDNGYRSVRGNERFFVALFAMATLMRMADSTLAQVASMM